MNRANRGPLMLAGCARLSTTGFHFRHAENTLQCLFRADRLTADIGSRGGSHEHPLITTRTCAHACPTTYRRSRTPPASRATFLPTHHTTSAVHRTTYTAAAPLRCHACAHASHTSCCLCCALSRTPALLYCTAHLIKQHNITTMRRVSAGAIPSCGE